MHTKLLATTACAGSLLLMPLMQGSAHSATLPSLQTHQTNLTLVAHPGGGGGGGRNGPHAMGGNGPQGMGNGPHMRGDNLAENGGRNFRHDEGLGEHNGRTHERFTEGDHDFDHHHGHGHRVFRNGVWVWVYGPDYYASGDCDWLLRRARVTGTPYWWHRYDACIGEY